MADRKTRLLMILTCVVLLALPFSHIYGQTGSTPQAFRGVDVVFLIDQSGSMGGISKTKGNDPQELRVNAVKWVIDFLFDDVSLLHKNATYRIGVVNFGSKAEISLPLTEIYPNSNHMWQDQLSKVKDQIKARDMKDTDFLAAFQKARDIFDQVRTRNQIGRNKLIILLTDGKPDLGKKINLQKYINQLEDFIRNDFSIGDFTIYVVAIDKRNSYWSEFSSVWNRIANGNTKRLKGAGDIPITFKNILTASLPQDKAVEQIPLGEVAMRPYLSAVIFTLFKAKKDDIINIYRENREKINARDTDVIVRAQQGTIETVTVKRPNPGYWYIEKDKKNSIDPQILREPIYASVELQPPSPKKNHPQHQPIEIAFRIVDTEGKLFPEHDVYTLDVQASLIAPGRQEVPLSLQKQSPSTYQTRSSIPPTAAGVYHVRVKGTSLDPDNKRFTVFDTSQDSFQVYPTTPIQFKILEPAQNAHLPLRKGLTQRQGFDVIVEVTDDKNQSLPPVAFARQPQVLDGLLTASVLSGNGGNPSISPIELKSDRDNPAYYVANIDQEMQAGAYKLQVQWQTDRIDQNFYPLRRSQTIVFTRTEHALIVWSKRLGQLMLTLAALGVLGGIGLMIYRRNWPAEGSLVIMQQGGLEIRRFELTPLKKNQITWTNLPYETELKKLRVKHYKGQNGIHVTAWDINGETVVNQEIPPWGSIPLVVVPYSLEYVPRDDMY